MTTEASIDSLTIHLSVIAPERPDEGVLEHAHTGTLQQERVELAAADAVADDVGIAGLDCASTHDARSKGSDLLEGSARSRGTPPGVRSSRGNTSGVSHPAHTLSRGKRARSATTTSQPARRSRLAAVEPAGPPPTIERITLNQLNSTTTMSARSRPSRRRGYP